jgi:phage terminase large subunit-like protein
MKLRDKIALKKYREKLNLIKSGATVNPFETKEEKQAIIERLQKDPEFFVTFLFPHYADAPPAWFHIKLLKAVLKNKTIRRLVRWGRGLAKSVVCDIFVPIYLWVNGEDVYLLLIGNNEKKAKQLLSDVQAEFAANPRILHYFGEQRLQGDWADGDFQTKDGRFIGQALGMGQDVRGLRKKSRRPNLVVADDLEDKDTVKNPKRQDEAVEWVENSVLKTMDGDTRRYLHPNNDPWPRSIQNVLEKRHPNWQLDVVKAYDKATYKPAWKGKYDKNYYRIQEEEDGILSAHAEYLHEPHVEGKVFKNEQVQWKRLPKLNHFKTIVGHWDVAYAGTDTSDYNAVRVWGLYDGEFYYIDSFVKQSKMKEAVQWMVDFQGTLPESVAVHWRFESQFWNDEVKRTIQETEDENNCKLALTKVETPKKKKYDRIIRLQPYYQNGRIYYNDKKQGHNYTQIGLQQLFGIEPGYKTNDDAPDADEQAIGYLEKHNKRSIQGGPRTGKMRKNKRRRA